MIITSEPQLSQIIHLRQCLKPHEVDTIRKHLWEQVHKLRYDVNGYAILFSSETGVREGEIPSLKWSDVKRSSIHIHSQQNDEKRDGLKVYYYNPTTKNEKGVSNNGRFIPLTNRIREILDELKAKQKALGIHSEWVFCKENGSWTTTVSYYESLSPHKKWRVSYPPFGGPGSFDQPKKCSSLHLYHVHILAQLFIAIKRLTTEYFYPMTHTFIVRKMGRASSCGRHACEPTEPAGETLKPRASRDSSVRLYKEMTQTMSGPFLYRTVRKMGLERQNEAGNPHK